MHGWIWYNSHRLLYLIIKLPRPVLPFGQTGDGHIPTRCALMVSCVLTNTWEYPSRAQRSPPASQGYRELRIRLWYNSHRLLAVILVLKTAPAALFSLL